MLKTKEIVYKPADELTTIPLGSFIDLGSETVQLELCDDDERQVLKASQRCGREIALVKVGERTQTILGDENSINYWLVSEALEKLGGRGVRSSFTHTHWDSMSAPYPNDYDFNAWHTLGIFFPLCTFKVAFSSLGEPRSFKYVGYSVNVG